MCCTVKISPDTLALFYADYTDATSASTMETGAPGVGRFGSDVPGRLGHHARIFLHAARHDPE
jgi:hypothetical protein